MTLKRLIAAWAILPAIAASPAAFGQNAPERTPSGSVLRTFDTPYYTLHTDLPDADVREADLRMTRMFEEYQRRTAGFSGQVKGKFPFYLFRNPADYYAAGATEGSAGVFMQGPSGSKLMAIAGARTTADTWHVVQHEGFHQFIAATIHNDIPIWANEGLAEYFGEAIWTGDGFVSGLIPPARLKSIKTEILSNRFKRFSQLMAMSTKEWGSHLDYRNYDEAWAMVHFLAHADNGKYQNAFVQFMTQISKGQPAATAWDDAFGKDTTVFEARFANWWVSLPEEPTRSGYVRAMVQTQTSFYARAYLQRLSFPDPLTFFKTYRPPAIGVNRDFWLPPSLFASTSETASRVGDWTMIIPGNQPPQLICQDGDGTKYVGTFAVSGGKVTRVNVDVIPANNAQAAPRRY